MILINRRTLRALIRLHDISVEAGDCFLASQQLQPLIANSTVVQGKVYCANGCVLSHAWLVTPTQGIDATMGQLATELQRFAAPALGIWSHTHTRVPGLNNQWFYYKIE